MVSMPASRVTDRLVCPVHMSVGEVGAPKAGDVLVGGLTAARLSGLCLCGGEHISPLAEGAARVLVNGLPMARVGDHTLEGGVVAFGELSVLAGGEGFGVPSFIAIEGDTDFQIKVIRDIYIISTTPTGRKLFASMTAAGRKVRIGPWQTRADGKEPRGNITVTDPQLAEPTYGRLGADWNDPRAYDGTGINARIEYNPDQTEIEYNRDVAWAYPPHYSADVSLVHEMIHADEMMHGTMNKSPCDNPGGWPVVPCSELRARGVPPYDDTSKWPYSENTYRADRGYKHANFY